MKQPDKAIQEYIETNILPQYLAFDNAHNTDHAYDVIKSSLEIAQTLDVDINMVYVIAAYHDVGLKFGRKNHNLTSAEIMLNDAALKKWFSDEQLLIMKTAVEDHRASNGYEPRNLYGKIISEADRQLDAQKIILRTVEYGKANYPMLSADEQLKQAYNHISEKYGENGYLKLWLYTEKNQKGLKEIRKLLKDKTSFFDICRKYL